MTMLLNRWIDYTTPLTICWRVSFSSDEEFQYKAVWGITVESKVNSVPSSVDFMLSIIVIRELSYTLAGLTVLRSYVAHRATDVVLINQDWARSVNKVSFSFISQKQQQLRNPLCYNGECVEKVDYVKITLSMRTTFYR